MSGILQILCAVKSTASWISTSSSLNSAITSTSTYYPKAVAYGNGIYVIVGLSGYNAVSSDGVNWSIGNFVYDAGADLKAICFHSGNNTFYATDNSGYDKKVWYSTDGSNWTSVDVNTYMGSGVYDICSNGSMLVIAGVTGACMTSTDGSNWTNRTGLATANSNKDVYTLAYNGTNFYAGCASGKCAYSSDGSSWTNITAFTTAYGSSPVTDIACNSNNIIAVGPYGAGCVVSTDGGTSWTSKKTALQTIFGAYDALLVCWNGIEFLTTGSKDANNLSTASTVDTGTNWSSEAGLTSSFGGGGNTPYPSAICTNGNIIIVVGRLLTTNEARSVIYK